MTTDIETLLSDALRDEVSGLPAPSPDVLARAVHRNTRRTAVRRTASTAGALGLAAGLGIALTITATGNRSPGAAVPRASGVAGSDPGSPSGTAQAIPPDAAPKLKLISALTTTDLTSYRIRQTIHGTYLDRPDLPPMNDRFTGLLDPAHSLATGELVSSNGWTMQLRLVDGVIYTHPVVPGHAELPWFKDAADPGTLAALAQGGVPTEWSPWTGPSSGAAALLTTLRTRGTVSLAGSTGTGPNALDTYRFGYDRPDDGTFTAEHITGTVVVHRDTNLIARFDVGTTTTGHIEQVTIRWAFTVELSDYGIPVTVTAPAGALRRGQDTRRRPAGPQPGTTPPTGGATATTN